MKHYTKLLAVLFITLLSNANVFASTLDSIATQPVPGKPIAKDALQAHAMELRELTNKISLEKNASKKKHLQAEHKLLIKEYNDLKAHSAQNNKPTESDHGD